MRKLVTDFLVRGNLSASQYTVTSWILLLDINHPSPSCDLIYLTILSAASKCDCFGSCRNWLTVWTWYEMSCLVTLRYNNFPINFWYLSCSTRGSLSALLLTYWSYCLEVSLIVLSIGVLKGLAADRLVSEMSSSAYFLWCIVIVSLDLENSNS